MTCTAIIDGVARSNPGPAGWGAVIAADSGRIAELHGALARATNNVAEHHGLIAALGWCTTRRVSALRVRSDSHRLVQQMRQPHRTIVAPEG